VSFPKRKHPQKGVLESEVLPTIVFLTVCTRHRASWLADPTVHAALISIWRSATFWKAGPYVLMPDHLHLFAWPGTTPSDFDRWVRYWKSRFSNTIGNQSLQWQPNCFHHRLRSCESMEAKRLYMINNPVRAGLVTHSDKWPFQGEIYKNESCGEQSGRHKARLQVGLSVGGARLGVGRGFARAGACRVASIRCSSP
jgi:putative transposase